MTRFGEASEYNDWDPPDGSYRVAIVDTRARFARTGTGLPHAVCQLQIIGTADAGRRFDHFMNLASDAGLSFAREALIVYGMDPDTLDAIDPDTDIDALAAAMRALIGVTAHVTVSHWAPGKINVRVDGSQTALSGLAPSDTQPDPFAAAAAAASDDVPFG